jgi:hypothetical protein
MAAQAELQEGVPAKGNARVPLNVQLAIIFVLGCFALGLLTLWTP